MTEQRKHDVFQAISDSTRRNILKILAEREMSIAELVEHFPISRTAINKHLHILSNAGIVKSRKVGRETRYILEANPLVEIQDFLAFFETYWADQLVSLKRLVEEEID